MTHDELLSKIHEEDSSIALFVGARTSLADALRAVVELHKPIEGHGHLCGGCWFGDGMMAYPCPTIQAIEKELT